MDNIFVIWAMVRNSSCGFCKLAFKKSVNPYFSLPWSGLRDHDGMLPYKLDGTNSINSFFSCKFRSSFSIQKILTAWWFASTNIKQFLLETQMQFYVYLYLYHLYISNLYLIYIYSYHHLSYLFYVSISIMMISISI